MMSLPGLTDYDIIQNQPQWCQHFYIIIYNIFYILLCGLQFSKKEKENKFSHLRCTYHQLCSTKGQKQENQLRPAAAGLICCRRFTTSTNGSFEAGRKDSSGGKWGEDLSCSHFWQNYAILSKEEVVEENEEEEKKELDHINQMKDPSPPSRPPGPPGPRSRNPNQVKVNGSSAPDLF